MILFDDSPRINKFSLFLRHFPNSSAPLFSISLLSKYNSFIIKLFFNPFAIFIHPSSFNLLLLKFKHSNSFAVSKLFPIKTEPSSSIKLCPKLKLIKETFPRTLSHKA